MFRVSVIALSLVAALAILVGCENGLLKTIKNINDDYRAGLVPPAAPGAPVVTAANAKLEVTWTAVPGADSYDVYCSDNPATIPTASSIHTTGTSASITGLTNGITYYVWVRAINTQGPGPMSPSANGKPVAPLVAPSAPTGIKVTRGDCQLAVSWDALATADSYIVYWSPQDDTATIPDANNMEVTDPQYTIPGLLNDNNYYIWVKAKNGAGLSGYSLRAQGTPVPPPPAVPGAPTLTQGNQKITASWTAIDGATDYDLFWHTVDDTASLPPANVASTKGTSYEKISLINGTTYYFWLKARNSGGSSGFSPSANAMPLPPIPATPAKPSLAAGNLKLTVQWAAVEWAESYDVLCCLEDSTSADPVRTAEGVTVTSCSLDGLANGIRYYVWVRAKNIAGSSAYSPSANEVPVLPLPAAPAKPSLTAANSKLTVQWQGVDYAASYGVYWSMTDITGTIPVENTHDTANLYYDIGGLANGTTYYVWVKARNDTGSSGFSPSANAVPIASSSLPAVPGVPTLAAGDGQLSVSLAAAAGADYYIVSWHSDDNISGIPVANKKTISGLTTSISPLSNGTKYYVWAQSMNNVGTSAYSPSCGATPVATPSTPILEMGKGKFTASWNACPGATSYEVMWHTANDTASIPSGNHQSTTSASTIVSSLASGTVYYVWVKGLNADGESNLSPSANGITVPAEPFAPTLTPGDRQLSVSWSAVMGADLGYDVFCNTVNNSASSTNVYSTTESSADTSATILGLTNGEPRYVWIKAKNISGSSGFSPSASGIPYLHVSSVELSSASPLIIGNSLLLTATVLPAGATNAALTWSTSNAAIATVAAVDATTGNVTAHAAGTARITATATDGGISGYRDVTVLSNAKVITAYSFLDPAASGTIDQGAKTIAVPILYSDRAKRSSMTASFSVSAGATVKVGGIAQTSGTTANNFTNPVIYTVFAADGSSVEYTVTVSIVMGEGVIGVIEKPDIAVSIAGLPASQAGLPSPWVRGGAAFTVTAVATEGGSPATGITYQWSLDGVDVNGATASTFVIDASLALSYGSHTLAVFVFKNGYGFSHEALFTVVKTIGEAGGGEKLAFFRPFPSIRSGPRRAFIPAAPPESAWKRGGSRHA